MERYLTESVGQIAVSNEALTRSHCQLCSGCHWHAAPHFHGHKVFGELSPLAALQSLSTSRKTAALETAWLDGGPPWQCPSCGKEPAQSFLESLRSGLSVCKRPFTDLLPRFRSWAKKLAKEDVSDGLLIVAWRSYFMDEQLVQKGGVDQGLLADEKYAHVSHVNW